MSAQVVETFTDRLAHEAESLFIVYRGKRCWYDWHHARYYAYFESLIWHRKQSVHGAFVAGRWYWHVRTIPLSGDGAGVPPALGRAAIPPAALAGAPSAPAPSSPHCGYTRGPWLCTLPPHGHDPDRHYLVHRPDSELVSS